MDTRSILSLHVLRANVKNIKYLFRQNNNEEWHVYCYVHFYLQLIVLNNNYQVFVHVYEMRQVVLSWVHYRSSNNCKLSRQRQYYRSKQRDNSRHISSISSEEILDSLLCFFLWAYISSSECTLLYHSVLYWLPVCLIRYHFVPCCPLKHYSHIGFFFVSLSLSLRLATFVVSCCYLWPLCLSTVLLPSPYLSKFSFSPFSLSLCHYVRALLS